MSMQEKIQEEFHDLLNECNRLQWENLELKILIQYANMEKRIWEDKNLDHPANNMLRVIEMAESLNKLKEERTTL